MATTSAGNPYVESSDLVANYPATSLALANRLDKYAVNPFADATARDAAIPTPVQGQLAQTLDDNKVWRYDGTAWAPFSGAVGAASFTNTPTGTYTDAGIDYKYITFTGTGNIEFDVAGFIDLMLVSGGGAGGSGQYGSASGGGAGSYIVQTNLYMPLGTGTVVIGAGGAGTSGAMGTNGTDSSLILGGLSIKGIGGGAGATASSGSSNPGGSGGAPRTASATLISGKGLLGGNDASTSNPGGGGGSGSAGSGVTGGNPTSYSITGSAVDYAAGGRSGTNNEPGGNNTGTGGSGATSSTVGVAGGSGIAVIRVVV